MNQSKLFPRVVVSEHFFDEREGVVVYCVSVSGLLSGATWEAFVREDVLEDTKREAHAMCRLFHRELESQANKLRRAA